MKPLVCALLLAFLHLSPEAQVIYSGHLREAGTNQDVVGAEVSLLNSGERGKTNIFGNFVFSKGGHHDLPFQFFNNTITWKDEAPTSIVISALDGRKLTDQKLTVGATYLIPRLKAGIYLMHFLLNGKPYFYKIASDGLTTTNVDTKGIFHQPTNEPPEPDTLLIEKEGYYSRKIPLTGRSSILELAMLKGEYENLDYFNELTEPVAFDIISSTPSRSNLGDVKSVKIVYDTNKDALYYMNSKKYKQHHAFASQVLGFKAGQGIFNQTQYTDNPNRYLHLASLNYYHAIDKYVLQFVTAVEMSCEHIEDLYKKIETTSFIGDQLHFFPIKKEWESCPDLQIVSSEELYQGQTYQGLNLAENFGYLRKVSVEAIESVFLNRRDIVLSDGIPNDLPVVAGIITSEFQTPLSHINVLSNSRDTPNMAVREAWSDPNFNELEGELVYLDVGADNFEIRKASLAEASSFWEAREPQDPIVLEKDLDFQLLSDIEDVSISDVNKVGGKAANFGELVKVGGIPTPENAFAIPFYYYEQHMQTYGLNQYMASMLSDPEFETNAAYRNEQLGKLRDSIKVAPINPELVSMVSSKISNFQDFPSFRFRSSTNAEDLEDFSGAGLYDSKSAKKNHATKTVEAAIKKVWASLWSWRAFEERAYFKIDHQSCAMGILVHRSFPDEDANGVLLTKNLYNANPGFIINVQYKEESIVFPRPGIIHDQIMLFTWSINPGEEFMIEYLSFSNVPELGGQRVMTDQEILELGRYANAIKRRFYYDLPHNCNCVYDDFGVDIEFKVDSEVSPRKIYVKQARLFR